jgi:hypothetical protein
MTTPLVAMVLQYRDVWVVRCFSLLEWEWKSELDWIEAEAVPTTREKPRAATREAMGGLSNGKSINVRCFDGRTSRSEERKEMDIYAFSKMRRKCCYYNTNCVDWSSSNCLYQT